MTQKERYWFRKENGICVSCGEAPAETGKVRCRICAQLTSLYTCRSIKARIARLEAAAVQRDALLLRVQELEAECLSLRQSILESRG